MTQKLTWHKREVDEAIHFNDDNTVEIVMKDTQAILDIDRADLMIEDDQPKLYYSTTLKRYISIPED